MAETLDIYLFATVDNAKYPNLQWRHELVLVAGHHFFNGLEDSSACPRLPLITRIVSKARKDKAMVNTIAPYWPRPF